MANSLGFLVASVSKYYLNRIWTFHSLDPGIGWQFFKFLFVALICAQ